MMMIDIVTMATSVTADDDGDSDSNDVSDG